MKERIEAYIKWAGYTHTYENIMADYESKKNGYYISHSSNDIITKVIEGDWNPPKYYTCECGSNKFVRMYNVFNETIQVEVTERDGEELWDVKELGKEKDHLVGYICADCRQDAQELNDGL